MPDANVPQSKFAAHGEVSHMCYIAFDQATAMFAYKLQVPECLEARFLLARGVFAAFTILLHFAGGEITKSNERG